GRFACFSGSHGRFYMAKRQGYVASGSQGAFPAILPLHNRPYEDEKEQKICPPALDGYHHAAIGKVFWRDGKVIWRSTMQITGDIFLVLSAGHTGMRTGCRTPEGVRQDVAPPALPPSLSRRGQDIPRTISRQAHGQTRGHT